MEKTKLYDKTIYLDDSYLRIEVNTSEMIICYNDHLIATSAFKTFKPFTHIFYAEENGKAVTYDITLLITSYVRCLVGRNGWLVYSDDSPVKMSSVDHVTNHLHALKST